MSISTQMKMLRAVREILLGDGRNALPQSNDCKPDFHLKNTGTPLPRSTPEEQGLASSYLVKFYREISNLQEANAHALLVLRNGHVISEGYFSPFRKDIWHISHSLCKTITGAAVGLAIQDGLFELDDPVFRFFPAEAGVLPSKRMRSITVRHLLTMTSGISFNEVSEAVETNWLRGIFASSVTCEPGSKFVYNSMNSYLLAALVCRASGAKDLMEYLQPRLFAPMHFGPIAWEKSPEGIEKGGWGMYMMAEDMAKFGLLHLQNGGWHSEGSEQNLLPSAWIQESVCPQVQSDKGEEYGFHVWVDSAAGCYTMNGMFGQYVTVFPKSNIVIVLTSGNPRLNADSNSYRCMLKYFSKALPANKLPPAPASLSQLNQTLASLQFRRPAADPSLPPKLIRHGGCRTGWPHRSIAPSAHISQDILDFCGTTWRFSRNRAGISPIVIQAMNNNFTSGLRAIHLEHHNNQVTLFWEEGGGTLSFPLNFAKPQQLRLHLGKESFIVSCKPSLRYNEDNQPVIYIELCFLEHSSFRLIKLTQAGTDLLLELDEHPQLSIAIGAAMQQSNSTGAQPKASPLSSITNSDYMDYRIRQLCSPILLGTPV